MGFFGQNPLAEADALAAGAGSIAQALNQWQKRKELKTGLQAAMQLLQDQEFAPRDLSDLARAKEQHKQAMQTILSLSPETQQKVFLLTAAAKKAMGQRVPPQVAKAIAALGQRARSGSPAEMRAGLVEAVAASPAWAASNADLIGKLQGLIPDETSRYRVVGDSLVDVLAGKPVYTAPDRSTLKPVALGDNQVLVDPRTGRVIAEGKSTTKPVALSKGGVLVDPGTGKVIAKAGDEPGWSEPRRIPGLGGFWQMGPDGKLAKVDDTYLISSAKDAILRAHGASEFSGLDPDLQPKVLAEFEEAERLIRESGYSPMQAARAAVSKWTTEDVVKPVPEKRRSGLLGTRETDTAEAAKTLAQSFRKAMSTGQKVYKSQVMKELIAKGYSPDEAQQIIDQARGMVQ